MSKDNAKNRNIQEGREDSARIDQRYIDAVVAEHLSRMLLSDQRFYDSVARGTILGSMYRRMRDDLINDLAPVISRIVSDILQRGAPKEGWAISLKNELDAEKRERSEAYRRIEGRIERVERLLSDVAENLKVLSEEMIKMKASLEERKEVKEKKKQEKEYEGRAEPAESELNSQEESETDEEESEESDEESAEPTGVERGISDELPR